MYGTVVEGGPDGFMNRDQKTSVTQVSSNQTLGAPLDLDTDSDAAGNVYDVDLITRGKATTIFRDHPREKGEFVNI